MSVAIKTELNQATVNHFQRILGVFKLNTCFPRQSCSRIPLVTSLLEIECSNVF